MNNNYKTLKLACYSTNVTMSVVGNISPLLFLTFRSIYGFSYSMLGFLVFVNFCTQLIVDLVFSFFSNKFDIAKTVKLTPVISVVGLLIYALAPVLFPGFVYGGILIGTLIFSASSGLAEVLISPVIAAIPAEDPDKEMSKLHSVYAWGVVGVILVSTVFLFVFGSKNWQYLIFLLMLIPVFASLVFQKSEIPYMPTIEKVSGVLKFLKSKTVLICIFAIFLGGAMECTMAQWASGLLEKAFGIKKTIGDIFGVAFFSVMLGLGRTMYAKSGKNIENVLLIGAIGAFICYVAVAVTSSWVVGIIACAITGLCVSMLWPGSLIVASNLNKGGGVVLYALMAAGGDLGASVGPQLVGVIADISINNSFVKSIALKSGILAEQLGMKFGILIGALFSLIAIFVFIHIKKSLTLANKEKIV